MSRVSPRVWQSSHQTSPAVLLDMVVEHGSPIATQIAVVITELYTTACLISVMQLIPPMAVVDRLSQLHNCNVQKSHTLMLVQLSIVEAV